MTALAAILGIALGVTLFLLVVIGMGAAQMPRFGFIGDDPREVEFEPFPDSEPITEPSTTPATPEPVKEPAHV